jgi:GTP cyclohydrolase I
MDVRAPSYLKAVPVIADDAEPRPSREEAEAAVRTLIRWAGDDPRREGLSDTPRRVLDAYEEWFQGYGEDPDAMLERTFGEVAGYREMVLLKDITFASHCEHHMAPIIGRAHVAYLPRDRVVGISKLARVVDVFARRLQIQERMTAEIAQALDRVLKPAGVAVTIDAVHECMTTRGVNKTDGRLVTTTLIGAFDQDPERRREYLAAIASPRA